MVQNQISKLWHPARFVHCAIRGSDDPPDGQDGLRQYSVIILNNPLENKDLLVSVCVQGMHDIKLKDPGLMAHIIHQLNTLYVLTAEQTNSIVYILLERKKQLAYALRVLPACHILN